MRAVLTSSPLKSGVNQSGVRFARANEPHANNGRAESQCVIVPPRQEGS